MALMMNYVMLYLPVKKMPFIFILFAVFAEVILLYIVIESYKMFVENPHLVPNA